MLVTASLRFSFPGETGLSFSAQLFPRRRPSQLHCAQGNHALPDAGAAVTEKTAETEEKCMHGANNVLMQVWWRAPGRVSQADRGQTVEPCQLSGRGSAAGSWFGRKGEMSFPESVILEAWTRSYGRCECTKEGHHHSGRCNHGVHWDRRGTDLPGGWEAVRKSSRLKTVTLENCEIRCIACQRPRAGLDEMSGAVGRWRDPRSQHGLLNCRRSESNR
jgi:hypothetical protein